MPRFWTDVYRKHFEKHLRKPFDIQVYYDPDGFGLKLATHDLALGNRRVYASLGLADKLADREAEDFGEAILVSDVADKEVPLLFVNALFFILHHDISLASRFAIGGVAQMQPAFAHRHKKAALYFALAEEDDNQFNKVRRGEDFGRVYQAYFITAEEDRFLAEYGPDEFEKPFNKLGPKRDWLGRPSCV